jgi:hypothetical protein
MNTINKAVTTSIVKAAAGTKAPRKAKPTAKPGKPAGILTITSPIERTKRPFMLAEANYGQMFIREGELCMRVLNVCDKGIKGQASKIESLWITSLSKNKTWEATNTPIELVDVKVEIVNRAVKDE